MLDAARRGGVLIAARSGSDRSCPRPGTRRCVTRSTAPSGSRHPPSPPPRPDAELIAARPAPAFERREPRRDARCRDLGRDAAAIALRLEHGDRPDAAGAGDAGRPRSPRASTPSALTIPIPVIATRGGSCAGPLPDEAARSPVEPLRRGRGRAADRLGLAELARARPAPAAGTAPAARRRENAEAERPVPQTMDRAAEAGQTGDVGPDHARKRRGRWPRRPRGRRPAVARPARDCRGTTRASRPAPRSTWCRPPQRMRVAASDSA